MTDAEFQAKVQYVIERAEQAYAGEKMLRYAVEGRLGKPAWDVEEAAVLLIESGWTWDDVLTVNS